MNAVELEGVSKSFGNFVAVDDLNLTLPPGVIYGFIGPNGSGKTTTIRMILRIFHPDRGRVVVFGHDHGDVADQRVGYLPEERGLYKRMKVRDVLRFYTALKGMRDSGREIDHWLERFSLSAWANKRVDSLSKGMAQKVQFISAVASKPQLLILDEPFSGLDPVNREIFKDAILELRQNGVTVLFSTHDMAVAEQMCDLICMIFRGKKVLDGSLADIQSRFGEDTIRIRAPGTNGCLDKLPGVLRVNEYGRYRELRIAKGTDPQQILNQLVQHSTVEHFEIARPTLHDIFVRIAGVEGESTQEATYA